MNAYIKCIERYRRNNWIVNELFCGINECEEDILVYVL